MSTQGDNPYAAPANPDFSNPRAKQTDRPLASLGDRFLGALIDGVVIIPIAFGVGVMLGIVLVITGFEPAGAAFRIVTAVLGALLGAAIFLSINGYLLATKGQTVGKLVMKTQIVSDQTHSILPFGELVLKRYVPLWIVSAIPVIGPVFGLVDALFIFRENRKCVHDQIAGTQVIKLG